MLSNSFPPCLPPLGTLDTLARGAFYEFQCCWMIFSSRSSYDGLIVQFILLEPCLIKHCLKPLLDSAVMPLWKVVFLAGLPKTYTLFLGPPWHPLASDLNQVMQFLQKLPRAPRSMDRTTRVSFRCVKTPILEIFVCLFARTIYYLLQAEECLRVIPNHPLLQNHFSRCFLLASACADLCSLTVL